MNRKYLFLLLLFIVLDTCYSFMQHFHVPHDGDMAAIIVPAEWYTRILQEPFGLDAVLKGEHYSGTNRFFAHWSLSNYFKTMPLVLQLFVQPVTSSYLASALVKITLHVALIYLLAAFISGTGKARKPDFILAAALMVPLFQTGGYYNDMGVIDRSITYDFFYALSFVLLLLFFLPFYRAFVNRRPLDLTVSQLVVLAVLALVAPFQGPLIPAVVLIVCPAVLLYFWWQALQQQTEKPLLTRVFSAIWAIPGPVLFYFSLITLLSLYSLYLGTFNAENSTHTMPLSERYARLLPGLFYQLTGKIGYPLLLALLLLNAWLLRRQGPEAHRLLRILKWVSICCAIYLLLLPLGGYRNYRPWIIRRDTFLPVTLCMFYFFGISTLYILKHVQLRSKQAYVAALLLFAGILTFADRKYKDPAFSCERDALRKIAASAEPVVKLDTECNIMSWETIRDPGSSEINARLLQIWRVTKGKKLFYKEG